MREATGGVELWRQTKELEGNGDLCASRYIQLPTRVGGDGVAKEHVYAGEWGGCCPSVEQTEVRKLKRTGQIIDGWK